MLGVCGDGIDLYGFSSYRSQQFYLKSLISSSRFRTFFGLFVLLLKVSNSAHRSSLTDGRGQDLVFHT
jgi:hypothetical protein